MASQPSTAHQNRRLRKLPLVVRRYRSSHPSTPAASFYTYQNALLWIRNQQDLISRFVQLLQTYPNLIQDESMDHFWEFIEPLLLEEKETKSRGASAALNSPGVKGHVTRLTGGAETPTPSYFQFRDIPSASTSRTTTPDQHTRTPLVHIISHCDQATADDEKAMHGAVIGTLQEDFFVKVTKNIPGPPNGRKRDYVITETDACVYLFNDSTLADPHCFNDLCVALSRAIPVVYIKHPKLELPQAFLDVLITRICRGYASWRDYIENFELNHYTNIPSKKRHKEKLEPLDVKYRPSSTRDSMLTGSDGRRGKRRHSPIPSDNDLVYTLTNAFKDACVFDETDIKFQEKLKQVLHKSIAVCEAKPDLLKIGAAPAGEVSRDDTYLLSTNTPIETADRTASHRAKNKPVLLGVPGSHEIISSLNWPISGHTLTSLFDRSNNGEP
ncbi:unnamed protein product, partial [Lymnaea stagnalis]